jgi:hypothetical protein
MILLADSDKLVLWLIKHKVIRVIWVIQVFIISWIVRISRVIGGFKFFRFSGVLRSEVLSLKV